MSLVAKNIMLRGTFLAILCQVTDCFSSMRRPVKPPCIVRFLTFSVQRSLTSSEMDFLTCLLALMMGKMRLELELVVESG